MSNLTKLWVVGAMNYGSPHIGDVKRLGESFEVEEAIAVKMLRATKRDIANNVHPILVRSGDPRAAKYEQAAITVKGNTFNAANPEAPVVTKKRATRKKRASA